MNWQKLRRNRKLRAFAILAPIVAVMAAGVAAVPMAGAATGTPITGVKDRCADVAWSQKFDGAFLHLWNCNGSDAQNWTVEGDEGQVKAFGKCMDVPNGKPVDGAQIQLWTCNGSDAQIWKSSNGMLVNKATGKCLDSHFSDKEGAKLVLWSCATNRTQKWTLPKPVTPPVAPPVKKVVEQPPAEEKPAEEKPAEEKPAEQKPATNAQGDEGLENKMIELINKERAQARCAPLNRNDALTQAARTHSKLMADRKTLTHRFDDEPDMGPRFTSAGYVWSSIAENAAPGAFSTPEIAMYGKHDATTNFTGFMESEGHRNNILNCSYKDVGVGIARDSDGGPWWTQDFGVGR
jgi:uncharacterized protein YkwD